MLAMLDRSGGRITWRSRVFLAMTGLALLALPAVYLSRQESAHAESPSQNQSADQSNVFALDEKSARESPTDNPFASRTFEASRQIASSVAARPTAEFFPKPSEDEQSLQAALEKRGGFDFVQMPLSDAMAFIQDAHELQIQLDTRALEEAGVGSDTPINLKAEGIPVRSALRLLLDDHDLSYIIREGLLLITTEDKAAMEFVTRTYPVGDLVPETPVESIPGGGRGKPRTGYETLVEAITSTIYPQSWQELGGAASIVPVPVSRSLVISQTRDAHDEVLELLRSLRTAKQEGSTTGTSD